MHHCCRWFILTIVNAQIHKFNSTFVFLMNGTLKMPLWKKLRIRVIDFTSWNFALWIAFSSTTDGNWQILSFLSFTVSFIGSFPFHLNVSCWNERSKLLTLQPCKILHKICSSNDKNACSVYYVISVEARSAIGRYAMQLGAEKVFSLFMFLTAFVWCIFRFIPIIRSYFYHFYTFCVPQDDAVLSPNRLTESGKVFFLQSTSRSLSLSLSRRRWLFVRHTLAEPQWPRENAVNNLSILVQSSSSKSLLEQFSLVDRSHAR